MKRPRFDTFTVATTHGRGPRSGIVGEHWAAEFRVTIQAGARTTFSVTDLASGTRWPGVIFGTSVDAAGIVAELDRLGPFNDDNKTALRTVIERFAAEFPVPQGAPHQG